MHKQDIKQARVTFCAGRGFFPDRSGRNTLRLHYSLNEPNIAEGIRRRVQQIKAISLV